jgi:hypothetical protein
MALFVITFNGVQVIKGNIDVMINIFLEDVEFV